MRDLADDLWGDLQPAASRRLLLAAVEAFAKNGYHNTTTREIAAAAGMSPAAVYVHYKSKAELLRAISQIGHEAAYSTLEAAVVRHAGDPVECLKAAVAAFTSWHARNYLVARVIQDELDSLDIADYEVILPLRRRTTGLVTNILEAGQAAGVFAIDDIALTTRGIFSMIIDTARWRRPTTRLSPHQVGIAYANLVLRMVDTKPVRTDAEKSRSA